jgi:hypothetical protein
MEGISHFSCRREIIVGQRKSGCICGNDRACKKDHVEKEV